MRKLRKEKDEIVNRMEALLDEVKSVRTVFEDKEILQRKVDDLQAQIAENAEQVELARKDR